MRDLLRGVQPHDYDLTTSALPEETLRLFSAYGSNRHYIWYGHGHRPAGASGGDEPFARKKLTMIFEGLQAFYLRRGLSKTWHAGILQ